MVDAGRAPYQPRDQLWLWWLGDAAHPRRIGELSLLADARSVGLRYDPQWLAEGFALSEDLPLRGGLFVPAGKDCAAGAIDDARPDRWGERVIRKFEKSPRLSLLEFLYFCGDDRHGALGVSAARDAYRPWPSAPAPGLASLADMSEAVRKVLANEPVPELHMRLLRPGISLGGARPKALVMIEGESWIVKFSEGEEMDTELVEHAAMTLARRCGIRAAPTQALPIGRRHAVAVKRYDRAGATRIHAISAQVALRAAGEAPGYPQLGQLLRRVVPSGSIAAEQQELFRRLVFNILLENTDDHEKNHALLRDDRGGWWLSPAYDILPSAQGLGVQAMDVGERASESSVDNALSRAAAYGLKKDAARDIAAEVAAGVDGWHAHFRQCGVVGNDLDVLAQYIDGPALRRQRAELLRRFNAPSSTRRT